MDNLSVHKASGIWEAIEATGARLLYLPPYSPIESCWSKLRAILRKAKARTRDALDEALTQAIEDIPGRMRTAGSISAAMPQLIRQPR